LFASKRLDIHFENYTLRRVRALANRHVTSFDAEFATCVKEKLDFPPEDFQLLLLL